MHRHALIQPLACVLALATGLGLLSTADLLREAPASGDRQAAANAGLVRRFYAAANEAIATGDPAALTAVVAPGLLAPAPPGSSGNWPGLAERLAVLHAAAPALRLEPEAVVAGEAEAMARVAVRGAGPSTFLGLPLADRPRPWGAVDAFGVAGGRVVAHRSPVDGLGVLRELGWARLEVERPTGRVIAVERLTYAPGASRWAQTAGGAGVLYLEAGALTFETAGDAREPTLLAAAGLRDVAKDPREITPGRPLKLAPGDVLVLPERERYQTRNAGGEPAVALVLGIAPPPPSLPVSAGPSATPASIAVQDLGDGLAVALPLGEVDVALGRATLGPGARLAWVGGAGPVLLAVESGRLELATTGEAAWVRRGADGARTALTSAILAAGDGALLTVDTEGPAARAAPADRNILRNDGDAPLVALILTIQPAAAPAGTPTA